MLRTLSSASVQNILILSTILFEITLIKKKSNWLIYNQKKILLIFLLNHLIRLDLRDLKS